MSKARIAKRRKLCDAGHINDNVKSNQKVCYNNFCKANLKEGISRKVSNVPTNCNYTVNKTEEKANLYLNVPNVTNANTPREEAVGAIAVNPNK